MVDQKDRSEQRNVEAEERIELKELKKARKLLVYLTQERDHGSMNGYVTTEGKLDDYEKCARLIMDAKQHNGNIAIRTKAIWKHLNSKRGGGKGEDTITSLERKTFIITLSITTHLSAIVQGIQHARSLTNENQLNDFKRQYGRKGNYILKSSIIRLADVVLPDLRKVIEAVEDLISMERYEERAMEEAAKDKKK